MKKKILFSLLIVTALFIITGCGKKNESSNTTSNLHKAEFVDMRFNEPKNYSKKEPMELDEDRIIIYRFNEDENKTINLYYHKNKDYDETDNKYEEVTINGHKWRKFHDTDFGITYDTYIYVYNNGRYTIELNEVDKYQEEFDEFMKDVSLE